MHAETIKSWGSILFLTVIIALHAGQGPTLPANVNRQDFDTAVPVIIDSLLARLTTTKGLRLTQQDVLPFWKPVVERYLIQELQTGATIDACKTNDDLSFRIFVDIDTNNIGPTTPGNLAAQSPAEQPSMWQAFPAHFSEDEINNALRELAHSISRARSADAAEAQHATDILLTPGWQRELAQQLQEQLALDPNCDLDLAKRNVVNNFHLNESWPPQPRAQPAAAPASPAAPVNQDGNAPSPANGNQNNNNGLIHNLPINSRQATWLSRFAKIVIILGIVPVVFAGYLVYRKIKQSKKESPVTEKAYNV